MKLATGAERQETKGCKKMKLMRESFLLRHVSRRCAQHTYSSVSLQNRFSHNVRTFFATSHTSRITLRRVAQPRVILLCHKIQRTPKHRHPFIKNLSPKQLPEFTMSFVSRPYIRSRDV